MQSKNQVVISGISIFEKPEQTIPLSLTVRPTELEKRDRYPTLLLPPELHALFFILQCSGRVQSKNGVDLVEVIFLKVGEVEWSNRSAEKDKNSTAALLYLIMAAS